VIEGQDIGQKSLFTFAKAGYKFWLMLLATLAISGTCFAYNIYVNKDSTAPGTPNGSDSLPYLTIQDAITKAFNDSDSLNQNNPPVRIIVHGSTAEPYEENLNLDFGTDANPHNVSDITIQGDSDNPDNCHIVNTVNAVPVILAIGHSNSRLKVENLSISHSDQSSAYSKGISIFHHIGDYNYQFNTLEVSNCNLTNNDIAINIDSSIVSINLIVTDTRIQINAPFAAFQGIDAQPCGAAGSSAIIDNNIFTYPSSDDDVFAYEAIRLVGNFSDITINNNSFNNVKVSCGSINDLQNSQIKNNIFLNSRLTYESHGNWLIDNNRFIGGITSNSGSSLEIFGVTNSASSYSCNVQKNTFFDCFQPIRIGFPTTHYELGIYVSIINNSFLNCGGILSLQRRDDMSLISNRISCYRNNLYMGQNTAPFIIVDQDNQALVLTGDNRIPVSYSLFSSPLNVVESLILDSNIISVNPEIAIDNVTYTYTPIWNNDTRSPLIMAGYGNEGLGTPYHANRLDIGAVQYSEHPHEYVSYTFPPYSERNGLKWMSFPTLDRICDHVGNLDVDPDLANVFFLPIQYSDLLSSISWKIQDNYEQFFFFNGQEWIGDLGHEIIPQQGYKIQMSHSLEEQEEIAERGIIPQVSQYPLTIKAQSASKAPDIDNENWLGYFNPNITNVRDAFVGIIDNLWFIQTQNWTMVRQTKVPGSPWIMDYQWGKEPTLSYGDMVIVKCFSDDQFIWNAAAPSQLPVEKELPEYYEYEEKPDYVPIYVELDSSILPKEIALYVDDVCKGAAVVTDSLVEIPAYILDGVDPNAFIELRCIYDDKAAVDQIPTYQVWNPNNNSYENKALTLNRKNYYYMLKLDQYGENSPAPPETALSVYPNPFNPCTTLRFSLPETGQITLEIYNQKGQLVKSLARGNVDSGWHSKVWNGTDNQNRKVASGLYYSKLSYNGKSIVKKMVLLK